jgi:hypothetical protein
MPHADFPEDFLNFLKSGRQLEYGPEECEPGRVTLLPLKKIAPNVVYVDSFDAPFAINDPHAGEDGCYIVPVYNLVAECENYDPDGILIWLPDQKVFGSWDSENWDVLVFPNATWSDIAANPVKYLNAMWEPEAVYCRYLQPFPNYPFQPNEK